MNQTSATSQPGVSLLPNGTGTITIIHLALILLVAIAAIAIIVAGIRRKRLRDQAARQVVRHAEEAGIEAASAAPPEPAPPPATAPASPPVQASASTIPTIAPTPLVDEPIAAAPFGAGPAGEAIDPVPASLAASPADGPVTQLKGLGPRVASLLAELGISRIGQLAMLNEHDAAALDARLGVFSGRMARDRWIEQARLLSAGDRAGFEAAFGRL